MSKADNDSLERLHAAVAEVLISQVKHEITIEDEEGNSSVMSAATPALLGQAIKFLKDNDITSDPVLDKNINDLAEELNKKRKRGRLQLVDPSLAAETFEE